MIKITKRVFVSSSSRLLIQSNLILLIFAWIGSCNLPCIYVVHTRHEIVGIVKEVGSNVGVFKVGDSVGVGTYVNSCRECENCEEGLEIHCSKGPVFTFGGVDVDGTITKGGYSSFIVVNQR